MKRAKSLRSRLILSALIWVLLWLSAGGIALSYAFQRSAEGAFDERLKVVLGALVSAIRVDDENQLELARGVGDPRFEQVLSGWYWQIEEDEVTVLRSRSLWDQELALGDLPSDTLGLLEFGNATGPRDRPLRVLRQELRLGDAMPILCFVVAASLEELDEERSRFDALLAAALGLMGLGVLLAIVFQVQFGLRPLRVLTSELDDIRTGVRERLRDDYPDEVVPLVNAMTDVLDDHQARVKRARQHVGNLAHALKTPLTLLKAEIDSDVSGDARSEMREQVETVARLVDHHLSRAAASGRSEYVSSAIPVREVADAILDGLSRAFAERKLQVTVKVPADLVFVGEREDVEELMGNLLENAFKWAGTAIRVTGLERDGAVAILVEDDGPGMPEALRGAATERGKRFDERKEGFGLGLSIVSDLVELYGGSLAFDDSSLGGLAVEVTIPNPGEQRPRV